MTNQTNKPAEQTNVTLEEVIENLNESIEENNKVLDELKKVLDMNNKDEVEPALTLDERIDAIATKRKATLESL